MNRAQKKEEVAWLNETIGSGSSAFLIDFERLDMARSTDLRTKLRAKEGQLRIVKNRLAKRALAETALADLDGAFSGQTAIAWPTGEDLVGVAKVLRDFAKENEVAEFKAGVVEGQIISIEEFQSLADLPSREELIAKVLYLFQYPITGLATALNGVLRNFVVVMEQIRQQKESQQDA